MTRPLALVALALLAPLAGCGDDAKPPAAPDATAPAAPADSAAAALPGTDTLLGVASASADLSTFVALARASGFDAVLQDTSRTLTVFAPSNAAFEALGADALARLRADPEALRARLAGHALAYRVFSGDILDEQTVGSVGGQEMTLVPGDPLVVREGGAAAHVATPDLDADNGVIQVIDAVLGS